MFPLRCKLYCYSATEHLTQIYTGFGELAKRQIVRLSPVRLPNYSSKFYGGVPLLRVELNEQYNIVYDVSDSSDLPEETELAKADFYFKRSIRPGDFTSVEHGQKVFPLGLNYLVFSKNDFAMRRAIWGKSWRECAGQLIRSNHLLAKLLKLDGSLYTAHLQRFEGVPSKMPDPSILFMTCVWDPDKARSAEHREDLWKMALVRAECVRQLKREFGSRFVGGLQRNAFTEKYFPDCVLPNRTMSRKNHYLALLRKTSIGISTTGLHGSVGWKFAEYVAGAKAIVSQPLNCSLPGDLVAGRNYLEFTCPEQSVEMAVKLMEDGQRRYEMMKSNFHYYWNWLRPDTLILKTLLKVLSESDPRERAGSQPACRSAKPFASTPVGAW